MFNFDLQRFGGKGGYQSSGPIIAELSPEQKQSIALQNQYLAQTAPVLSSLVQKGNNALQSYSSPNFNQYYTEGLNRTLDASSMNQATAKQFGNDAQGLANINQSMIRQFGSDSQGAADMSKRIAMGQIPSSYQASVNQAVTDAVSPYQQQFSSMANKGVVNSTLGKNWAGEMARGATAAANSAFNQNMQTAGGLAGQYGSQINQNYGLAGNLLGQYGSQMNQNYGLASQLNAAYGASALAPLNFQTASYNAQTQPAKDFLTLGTQTYQPTGQAASQAYQWQAAMSAPAQNQYVQQPGLGGVLGSIAGGVAGNPALFCFPANTKIATANGDVNIQDVKVGDMVSTLCGEQEVTKTMQSIQPIMQINTDRGKLRCTETEVLLSVDGSVSAGDLINGDVLIHKDGGAMVYDVQFDVDECMVYEIVAPWFYADGFVIDGFDPEVE